MKFSEMFGQTYWYPEMLAGRMVGLTIATIEMEYIDDAAEPTPVVHFEDDAKALRLNRRNAAMLVEAFGDDTAACRGKEVCLAAEGSGRFAWVKLMPVVRSGRKRTAKRKSA